MGTDVIKYLCLGANFVGIGRPAIYGLIINGSNGVKRIFEILESELISAMQNGGFKNLKSFNLKDWKFRLMIKTICIIPARG